MRMKDSSITKKRKLIFFAYDLANFSKFLENNKSVNNYYDVIKNLEKL
jgi:NAD-dependent DNA ligase